MKIWSRMLVADGIIKAVRRRTLVLLSVLVVAGVAQGAQGAAPEDPIPQWASRYNGGGNSLDSATALATSPDGARVFVTGYSRGFQPTGFPPHDYATVAYDSVAGAQLWAARYNGAANGDDDPTSIAVSPDGSTVFVTGSSAGSHGLEYATVAYNSATGFQLWEARQAGKASSLAVSPDGAKVFVTGDRGTIAYATSDGALVWRDYPQASSVAVSPDGSIVFATGGRTYAYRAIDGSLIWESPNGTYPNDVGALFLRVSPDGSKVFVTGTGTGPYENYFYPTVYGTLAFDTSTGAEIWNVQYSGPGGRDIVRSLGVSPDGTKVFVTGNSRGEDLIDDATTVAFAVSSGAELWVARTDGSARSLAVSPDGLSVFVTGASFGPSGEDYGTVAFDAYNGAQFWSAHYNEADPFGVPDSAEAIATSPDGSMVFVTGGSGSVGFSADFLTVAYPTCFAGPTEAGPISGPVHHTVEPMSGPAAPAAHVLNRCVAAENGL